MKNMKKNSKGFTLIELLAVIVILGILMIVAIPMVTQYIESARKDTYADTAKSYISAAKYSLLNGQYVISGTTDICSIEDSPTIYLSQVDVDNTGGKSSFGGAFEAAQLASSFVKVTTNGGKTEYRIFMKDSKGAGTDGLVTEAELSGNKIVKSGAALKSGETVSAKICVKG